jgi:FSR family fosmidomycin resistance protein-like MFS transporter
MEPVSEMETGTATREKSMNRGVLGIVSASHFLNDATQALLIPIYPLLKDRFSLTFTQLGLISLTYQITGSLLQPLIGHWTDRHPMPRSLAAGMCLTLAGMLTVSAAPSYLWLILGACVLGMGSSVFHPESSRVARMASGGRFGLAQSVFQVGGNAGQACGPLLAAAIIVPHGQSSLSWLAPMPLIAAILLFWIGSWEAAELRETRQSLRESSSSLPSRTIAWIFTILLVLIFSKYFYIASINNYLIFYLTRRFGIPVQAAQLRLFLFMFAMAAGTLLGGPIGDRIGRRRVIRVSILGVAPFTLALPYLNLAWTTVTIFVIGFILSSAFPAIVVFAQELLPGRVGTVAGLFFGLSFGMAGIGAAVLGRTADAYGVELVYDICAYLPLLGLLALYLPDLGTRPEKTE